MTIQQGLFLATSQRATTWQDGHSQSTTIDLTFLTPRIYNNLVRCAPLDSAEEVENHTAVKRILESALVMISVREHWCKREVYGKRDERNEGIVRILTRLIAGVCCVVTSGV